MNVLVVGKTWGHRARVRCLLAEHEGVSRSRIAFRECPDADADAEIARFSLRRPGVKVWTSLEVAKILHDRG